MIRHMFFSQLQKCLWWIFFSLNFWISSWQHRFWMVGSSWAIYLCFKPTNLTRATAGEAFSIAVDTAQSVTYLPHQPHKHTYPTKTRSNNPVNYNSVWQHFWFDFGSLTQLTKMLKTMLLIFTFLMAASAQNPGDDLVACINENGALNDCLQQ